MKTTKQKLSLGFTLVELLITISIATMIISAVLFDYSSSYDRLALSATAQEVALSIREVQVQNISAKEFSVGSGNFTNVYGLVFDSAPYHESSYFIFSDVNNDNIAQTFTACHMECVKEIPLNNGIVVSCVGRFVGETGVNDCASGTNNTSNKVSISFIRPNPDSIIYFGEPWQQDPLVSGLPLSYIGRAADTIVQLRSPKGNTTDIIIRSTGQLLVK